MNNSKSTKIILVLTSLVFIAALVGDILWFNFVQKTADEVRQLRQNVSAEASQGYSLFQINKKIDEIKTRQVFIDQIFLYKTDTVSFIEKIESLGRISGVSIETKIFDAVDDGSYGKLNMIFEARGSWVNISNLLNLIENLPNHATINSIKFDSSSSGSGVVWNMTVSITVITK